jgi:DNA polymerase (family 10)
MDPRSAAHVLTQIASFLELRAESRFRIRAYEQAAQAVGALDTDDIASLDHTGALAATSGVGPATLAVLRDLITTGQSRYLEQLRRETAPGLVELLDVPGLAVQKIQQLHAELGIDSVDALEAAARDGRLASVKGFGPKTVARILRGVEIARESTAVTRQDRALVTSVALLTSVRGHPGVVRAELAGGLRRCRETVRDIDIVAACSGDPLAVAADMSNAPGVRSVNPAGTTAPSITFADGARLHLHCVDERDFVVALWRATGSSRHVTAIADRLSARHIVLEGDEFRDASGTRIEISDESRIYALADLPFIPPELREDGYEFSVAASGRVPALIELRDLQGVLHCHSLYSDGKATIAQMAHAARQRGWSYIGITDHSQAAFYAAGMSQMQVEAQHDEIDDLNAEATDGFRILKGIESDILHDGSLDYDAQTLDRFDFVVGAIHSRFAMDEAKMTARVLHALDDPHLTILAHPTGRLLLERDPFPIDMNAVFVKAAETGVAIELNADPKRLDLDWRLIPRAREAGVTLAIGPDAHSTASLDYVVAGIGIARKAAVEAHDVLNTRSADDVMAFARARRARST